MMILLMFLYIFRISSSLFRRITKCQYSQYGNQEYAFKPYAYKKIACIARYLFQGTLII